MAVRGKSSCALYVKGYEVKRILNETYRNSNSFTRSTIATSRPTVTSNNRSRAPAQPIREINPWGDNGSIVRSSTEPAGFDAFSKPPAQATQPFARTVTQSQSFSVKHRGDEWVS